MSNNSDAIKTIAKRLKYAADNIDEKFDKQRYEALVRDLDQLCLIRKERLKETTAGLSIEALLSAFDNQAIETRELVNKVLGIISERRVPGLDLISEMDDSIELLRDRYDSIVLVAEGLLSEDEMPVNDSSAADYVDAVNNSKSAKSKAALEAIRKTLDDFTAIISDIETYASALEKYQKAAQRLLNSIDDHSATVELASEQSSNAKLFMAAFECDDYDSDEGLELLEKVSESLGFKVQHGLSKKKYYISENRIFSKELQKKENENQPLEDKTSSVENANLNDVVDSTTVLDENREEKQSENILDEKQGVQVDDKKTSIPHKRNAKESSSTERTQTKPADTVDLPLDKNDSEESEIASLFNESSVFDPSDSIKEVVDKEISSAEGKKISSTIFSNELRQGNTNLAKRILHLICHDGMCTKSYLAQYTNAGEDMLEITLSYLVRKGYLRKYSISLGSIYCPSPRLAKAISNKEASKLIDVPQNFFTEDEIIELVDADAVAAGLASSNLRQYLNAQYKPQKTTCVSNTTERAFAFTSIFDGQVDNAHFIIGAFNPEGEEVETIIEGAEKQFHGNLIVRLPQVIIAGINKTSPVKFARFIFDNLELGDTIKEFYNVDVYGYSLKDNLRFRIEPSELEQDIPPITESADNKLDGDETSEQLVFVENEIEESSQEAQETQGLINEEMSENQLVSLVAADLFYAATAYEKAESIDNPERNTLYRQLNYALNDPMANCTYSSDMWFGLIGSDSSIEPALMISSAMRLFFSDQVRFDHNIRSVNAAISDYELLEDIPSVKSFIYDLVEFKDRYKSGLDRYADYHKKNSKLLDREIQAAKIEATDFYNKTIIGNKKEKTNHRRFIETMKMLFSPSGSLGECIKFVVDGDTDAKLVIEEFLRERFYDDSSVISDGTIDDDLLWEYIEHFWDIAGERMATRKRDDLTGHLKTNIISSTTKAVQILARWHSICETLESRDEDEGETSYRKNRESFLAGADAALNEIKKRLGNGELPIEEIASLKIVKNTLSELKARLEGEYSSFDRKFFYADFLLTDDVVLNENFLPDMECFSGNLDRITLKHRIIQHALKIKKDRVSYEDRLNILFDEQYDDLGTAKLIVDYLSALNPETDYSDQYSKIESSLPYAEQTASLRKADFIGEIELAQSYGQFDNSVENQKEIILKAADDWYNWAKETSNYGFFKKVLDEYMGDIHRNAKIREKDLLDELEAYKELSDSSLTVKEKEKKIEKIQKAIKEQNYTVAEDLLSRADFDDDSADSLIEEDYLKDFLDNYDDFYQRVAKPGSLSSVAKNRTRNKEERGAKRLAENWLPGGSRIGKPRLESLLNGLGFDVDDVKEQNTVGRNEEYIVKTSGVLKRQRNSYAHPIAALGSGMVEEGLRVVCLNGSYDADQLIDKIKTIGNAKPTLILLDYSLPLVERRKLARKTKNSLGLKLTAVLDRTAMMYLIKNYDETKVNRMLVSLIVPFAYCQPYVWESSQLMPPEIFMGRKRELERIKSATGVNIVYGGRQLGKSALLKKAKEEIDKNENNDRAVYIEIKGLDYKAAARKIGHELFDAKVLMGDIDTDDWDVLARVIKRRLQSEKDRIPYLLLLLDEADAFIDSCADVNYHPFDCLKELQNIGVGRFKFVIAGLRDIVRFKRDALNNNSVLTHLEPMTVTPFTFLEARELMEIPLHYLGFRFPKEKESLLTLIMATTNYFPGLIQMYCAKLVDALRNRDYAGYDVVDSPIYEVSEEHIKKVLSDPEFMDQIREKFEITLKLDEDNYYYLIALTMAWLYHNEGLNNSYTAEDIKRVGEEFGVSKLVDIESFKLESLMEELKELNVLRGTEDKHYRFTRFTFFQMMGTSDEVDNKLEEYMEA